MASEEEAPEVKTNAFEKHVLSGLAPPSLLSNVMGILGTLKYCNDAVHRNASDHDAAYEEACYGAWLIRPFLETLRKIVEARKPTLIEGKHSVLEDLERELSDDLIDQLSAVGQDIVDYCTKEMVLIQNRVRAHQNNTVGHDVRAFVESEFGQRRIDGYADFACELFQHCAFACEFIFEQSVRDIADALHIHFKTQELIVIEPRLLVEYLSGFRERHVFERMTPQDVFSGIEEDVEPWTSEHTAVAQEHVLDLVSQAMDAMWVSHTLFSLITRVHLLYSTDECSVDTEVPKEGIPILAEDDKQ